MASTTEGMSAEHGPGTVVVRVEQPGRATLDVIVESELEMGRECDGLLLADERVSRRHIRVANRDGRAVIADLGSSNGTFLDGERIDETVVLLPGSVVTIGDTRVTLSPITLSRRTKQTGPEPEKSGETGNGVRSTVFGASGDARPATEPDRRTSIESVADNVTSDASTMQSVLGNDETITILFSDIESSTEKALALGDTEWMSVLNEHKTIFERRVKGHGGRIIKNQGDGYMLTFRSARQALLCAAHIQEDLVAMADRRPQSAIRVRMGCHTGEAVHEDGDLFGRHVIIAARVANLAEGAEILVSAIVKEITSARGDLQFGDASEVELKGLAGTHEVSAFDWSSAPGVG